MIDHLLRFSNETSARAVLSRFVGENGWDTSQVIPDVKVYSVTGTDIDDDGRQIELRDYVAGFFVLIGLAQEDNTLNRLANTTVINRATKVRSKVDAVVAAKTGWKYEPVFAGI